MSAWKKCLTVNELEAELEKVCDELDAARADKIDVVCLPPPTVDEVSDEESIDDNEQLLTDTNEFPTELAGELEMVCEYKDGNRFAPMTELETQEENVVESTSSQSLFTIDSRKRKSKGGSDIEGKRKKEVPILPKWKKIETQPEFSKQPVDISSNKIEELYALLGSKSPLELFELFIDDEVIDLIVTSTNKYAQVDKNKHSFETNADEIKKFIGILYLTGFHTLPSSRAYWSKSPLLGSNVVKDTMSRNRFETLKRFLHVCDNDKLNKSDKFSKMSPFNDILNKRFMQFSVFSHKLSIDEQMIAYFGRHSCKMFIRGKPIRFGYKYWNMCSAEGYLYQFIPYAGASSKTDFEYSLGERVVLQLLSVLEHKNQHCVAFDNFFTSHKLLKRLSEMGYFATGTIRENRTSHAKVKDVREMKKCERGLHDQKKISPYFSK